MRIVLLALTVSLFYACQPGGHNHVEGEEHAHAHEEGEAEGHSQEKGHAHGHAHGEANEFMHERPIEELIAQFDSPSSLAWQKPDSLLYYLDNFTKVGLTGRSIA